MWRASQSARDGLGLGLVLMLVGCCGLVPAQPTPTPTPTPTPIADSAPVFPVALLTTVPSIEYANNPNYKGQFDPAALFTAAIQIYVNRTNQHGGVLIGGVPHRLSLSLFNVGFGNSTTDLSRLLVVANEVIVQNKFGYFPVILSPYSSLYVLTVAGICEQQKRIFIALAGSLDAIFVCPSPPDPVNGKDCITRGIKPGQRRYEYTFNVFPPSSTFWNGAIYMLKVAGANSVGFIYSSDVASFSAATGAITQASLAHMSVAYNRKLSSRESLGNTSVTDALVQEMMAQTPDLDALIVQSYAADSPDYVQTGNLMNSMKKFNWLPKSVGFGQGVINGPSLTNMIGAANQRYVLAYGPIPYDPRLKIPVSPVTYPSDIYVSSVDNATGAVQTDAPAQFYQAIKQALAQLPTPQNYAYHHAMGSTGALLIARALDHMRVVYPAPNETTPGSASMMATHAFVDNLRQAIANMYEDSPFGRLQYDPFGRLATEAPLTQTPMDYSKYDLIYPLSSATANFIYPIPRWDEREYTPGYLRTTTEQVVIAINSLVIGVVGALAASVFYFRHTNVMRAASPIFLFTTLAGCIAMLAANYFWTLYETSVSCALHVWFFSLGYTLMFAPLFAKTWRLWRIFCGRQMKITKWTNARLFQWVVAPMLCCELIILIAWHSSAPFTAQTVVMDPLRPVYSYDACYYSNLSQTWFFISVSYKIAILLCGCILIFKARDIPSDFNETPVLFLSIYSIAFASAILIPVVATNALSRTNCFIVRSFGIQASILISALILIVPKLYTLYVRGVHAKMSQNNRNVTHLSGSGSSDHSTHIEHILNMKNIRQISMDVLESWKQKIMVEQGRRQMGDHKRDSLPSTSQPVGTRHKHQPSFGITSSVMSEHDLKLSAVASGTQMDSYHADPMGRRSSQSELSSIALAGAGADSGCGSSSPPMAGARALANAHAHAHAHAGSVEPGGRLASISLVTVPSPTHPGKAAADEPNSHNDTTTDTCGSTNTANNRI